MVILSQADQICYAVLCVFSYFAAGQEQKKAILEQAARLPHPLQESLTPATATGASSPSAFGGTSPKGRISPQVTIPRVSFAIVRIKMGGSRSGAISNGVML